MTPHEQVKEKLIRLEETIKTAHPTMPVLLKEIHDFLKEQPDVVTLLEEEEIQVIVQGLARQTNVELISTKSKQTSAAKSKRVAAITEDDL